MELPRKPPSIDRLYQPQKVMAYSLLYAAATGQKLSDLDAVNTYAHAYYSGISELKSYTDRSEYNDCKDRAYRGPIAVEDLYG